MITLHEGDNRITLRRLIDEGVRVHSIVTDPPYGLVSIQKRFGKEGAAPARTDRNDGSFARLSGGFMGRAWDATGIERDPEFWRLIWEILLPGGYVFAFSGSRTGHWQAVAMEQAGFIMHPMHGWVFGSGFPKAHSARAAGPEWEGWAYGTQTQKPALEPIYLGQKPFTEKNGILNIQRHGVGAVNIDGCRVPTEDNLNGGAYAQNPTQRAEMWGEEAGNSWKRGGAGEYQQPAGRHPANLIHDGSAEVVALFPNGTSGKPGVRRKVATSNSMSGPLNMTGETEVGYADSGSAARFFNSFAPDFYDEVDVTWNSEQGHCQARLLVDTEQSPPKVIAASGSVESKEWNTFLFGNTITDLCQMDFKSTIEMKTNSIIVSKTLNWLMHSLTSASTEDASSETELGSSPVESAGKFTQPTISMSAKTAFRLGANLVASEMRLQISDVGRRSADPVFYNQKAGKEDRAGSVHPTVKPIALMQHLIRHITPPGGVVLDPFAGTGTTAEAARREGFECILMEAEPEYVEFLRSRFGIEDCDDLSDLLGPFDQKIAAAQPNESQDPLLELLG